ncbi:MAG: ABC transporter substrate-binding protein [Bryobacteraceae bacterium]
MTAAAARPRYGGTLMIELRDSVQTLDPASPAGDGAALMLPLVFDRLPDLSLSWTASGQSRRWEFRLRPGVRYHDGAPFAATPALAAALEATLRGITVKPHGDTLVFECAQPEPGLPLELARRGYVFARTPDGGAVGTGPFRLTRWEPGRRAAFAANEDHWAGRPFADAVEIEMGRGSREQLINLELGRADIVELAPPEARRARRAWASQPVELFAIVFRDGRPADPRLREALSAAVDRPAIRNVIFQKHGEPAGGILPQWISGYAFLFPAAPDLGRARKLAAASSSRALSIGYDAGDPLARLLAERVALNARDGGLAATAAPNPQADARILRWRIRSLESGDALREFGAPSRAETAEAACAAERALLAGYRVIPLVHAPVLFGASPRVHAPPLTPLGELRLADTWLEAR